MTRRMMLDRSALARFWSKVKRRGTNKCWTWNCKEGNYGFLWLNGKMVSAHRLSLSIHLGRRLAKREMVLHSCDNPRCVNPSHLYIGTHERNMQDKVERGRASHLQGSVNPFSKITEKEVVELRTRYLAGGVTQRELANEFGLEDLSHVGSILRGEVWKHAGGPILKSGAMRSSALKLRHKRKPRFSADDIKEIKKRLRQGYTQREVAKEFGTHQEVISRIVNRRTI